MDLAPNPPSWIQDILYHLGDHDLRPVIVGGPIRDLYFQHFYPNDVILTQSDWDIEVFGASSLAALELLLVPFGPVYTHGQAFGILHIRHDNETLDIALPRCEVKIEKGHRGFLTTPIPNAEYATAASRRDFTMNSLGWDWFSQTLLDPFNGLEDIKTRTLRHVGPAFVEDPLRVLRAVQFSARFGCCVASETLALCRGMWAQLFELPKERIESELKKWLLLSLQPSVGMATLKETYALHLFPELAALLDIPQDETFHPEGDVWVHTGLVLDAMVSYKTGDPKMDFILMLAALTHDMGKPDTTCWALKRDEWRWRSPKHDIVGVSKAQQFLGRFTQDIQLIDIVKRLVKTHMRPGQLYYRPSSQGNIKTAVLKLSQDVTLSYLWRLVSADGEGRTERYANDPVGPWLQQKSQEWQVEDHPPEPIIKGRHLIEMGLKPSPQFKAILEVVLKWQINQKFNTLDEGLICLHHYLKSSQLI